MLIAPAAVIAAVFFVRESRDERAHGLDIPGVVSVTLGLSALVFGIVEAARYGWWTAIGNRRLGRHLRRSDRRRQPVLV